MMVALSSRRFKARAAACRGMISWESRSDQDGMKDHPAVHCKKFADSANKLCESYGEPSKDMEIIDRLNVCLIMHHPKQAS